MWGIVLCLFQELLHQREQLNNIEGKTTKINQDLKTSQKHITSINSIFGGIKNWWYGDKDKDKDSKSGEPKTSTSKLQDTVEKSNATRPHPGERLRTDDGRGFYEEEEDLDSKFMRGAKGQNQYFKPVTKSRKEEVLNENLGMSLNRIRWFVILEKIFIFLVFIRLFEKWDVLC